RIDQRRANPSSSQPHHRNLTTATSTPRPQHRDLTAANRRFLSGEVDDVNSDP
ncbi:unnamed protein product, partial [Lota lota]